MTSPIKRLLVLVGAVVAAILLYFAFGEGGEASEPAVVETSSAPTEAAEEPEANGELEELRTVVATYLEARWSFSCADTPEVRKQRILATGVVADPTMLDNIVLDVGTTLREEECTTPDIDGHDGSVEAVARSDRLTPGHFEVAEATITMEVVFTMKDYEGNTLYDPDAAARTVFCEKIAGRWAVIGEI